MQNIYLKNIINVDISILLEIEKKRIWNKNLFSND